MEHIWILYVVACCCTSLTYEIFKSPGWTVVANLIVLFVVVLPYQVKMSKRLVLIFLIYILNATVDTIIVLSFTKYVVGEPFNQIYECMTSLVMILFAIVLERTISKEREMELPTIYRILLSIVPFISIVSLCYLAMTVAQQKKFMIIISAWMLLINMVIFYLYYALAQFYSEKTEKKMFEQMVDAYAYQLDLAQESQERVNALRHDMKHHIIELSSMIKAEENPEAIKYLKNMNRFMLNPKEYVATGNKEIDSVLNYLLHDVGEVLDHVTIDILIPEKSCWKDFTVCVILGNLVDNAIREAKKSEEKYLEIHIRVRKGVLLIDIENSYFGEIKEQNHRFKTTQDNVAIHGIGLENVKRIVRENGGEIKIFYENNRFRIKVLLYEASLN